MAEMPSDKATNNAGKHTTDVTLFSRGEGTDSELYLTMNVETIRWNSKSIGKMLLNYKHAHIRLMSYAQTKDLLSIAILTPRQEDPFYITEKDVLNHAVVRETKHKADDFLNSLLQNGYQIYSAGSLGVNKSDATIVSQLRNGHYIVTRVGGSSENERLLWARVIHASKMYTALSFDKMKSDLEIVDHLIAHTHLEMNVGEGPATQLPDDTLQFSEVSQTAHNTEITQQVDASHNIVHATGSLLQDITTTEPPIRLQELSERYIRIIDDNLEFSITNAPNDIIFEIDVPSGLYRFLDTTISTALQNFTLISCDVEFTIKVNANQAQCGRYYVAHWPNFDQMNNMEFDNVYRMLQRDHAIIDLSVSNDVVYVVKYENLRSFVAVQANEIGELSGGNFARVSMRCLSPLRIADSGNPRCPFQVFARLLNVKLTGMRYPLPPETVASRKARMIDGTFGVLPQEQPNLEMDNSVSRFDSTIRSINNVVNAVPVVGPINKLLGNIFGNGSIAIAKLFGVNMERIKSVESRLLYMGMINKDRPVDISHPSPLLPQPVHSYSYGRGPYVSKKMRLEPEATTPHFDVHCTVETTESILELAQVPGFCASFSVTTVMSQGDLLIELPVLPYDPRYRAQYPIVPHVPFPNAGGQSRGSARQLSPVAYFSQMYTNYSGSIVYDFVPVKTSSHNFTMQVAFVPFNGEPGTTTDEQMQSCKWKTIDFRTAESSSFTVPWISPMMMRTYPRDDSATQSVPNNMWNQISPDFTGIMKDPGKIVVRLVNPLNPTPIVSPAIDVLVFNRAHTNLRFLHPKPHNHASTMPPLIWSLTHELQNNGLTASRILPARGKITSAPLARLEMADGSVQKGDEQSPVEDPLPPAPGPYFQALENHTNILDVCRRFQYHVTLTGARSASTISQNQNSAMPFATFPLTVYSHPCDPLVTVQVNQPMAWMPLASFRDAVSQCFRYYRGSMNLVIHVLNDFPVEVTFIPPTTNAYSVTAGLGDTSQTFMESNEAVIRTSIPTDRGVAHEIIDPRVNPLQTIEVPFYNANIYNDCQGLLANPATWNPTTPIPGGFVRLQDKSVLDRMSLSMGQVHIRQLTYDFTKSPTDASAVFKARVSSALGDDFRYYHFMGTPPVYYNPSTTWTMATGNLATRAQSRDEINAELLKSGIESNPGPSFFSKGCSELKRFDPISNTAAMFSELKAFVQAPSSIAKDINDLKTQGLSILSNLETMLAAYTTGLDVLEIVTIATALLAALQEKSSWFSIVTCFLLIIRATGLFAKEVVASASSKLFTAMKQVFKKNISPVQLEANFGVEMDGTMVGSVLAGLIVESVTAVNDTMKKRVNDEFVFSTFARFFSNFNFMKAGAMCVFFNRFAAALTWLWKRTRKWIRGISNYDLLRDPDFIRSFMEDYSFVVNEMNLASIHMIQSHRTRYWSTVVAAYYLKSVLATVNDPKLRNVALLSAINEVIKKSNDVKSHMLAPPVRYEPFSLWLHGVPGTGKSTLALQLTIDMAKQIGHTYNADPVYTRSPHSQFWNGYEGQPVIHIDDANGVEDPAILGRIISEFQAITTCARMRIEMPRLEEKNSEVVSTILSVCSNLFCWNSSMIVDREAFLRRRHVVCRVDWSQRALSYFAANQMRTKSAALLPKEMVDNNEHLEFAYHHSPSDERAVQKMNFAAFQQKLYSVHKEYHTKEIEKMYARYEKSLSLAKEGALRVTDRATMKTAIVSTILGCENSDVISETIRRTLFELKEKLPQQFKVLPQHTQYIIDKMKAFDDQSETPQAQCEAYMDSSCIDMYQHCSPFVKEKIFANYSNSSLFQICDRIAPWRAQDKREAFFNDYINTDCASCRSPVCFATRPPVFICGGSTPDNQHWVCLQCSPNYVRASGNNRKCPVCRSAHVIKLSDQERSWSFYKKISYLAVSAADFVLTPVKVTFDYIWDNAMWLSYAMFLLTLTASATYMSYNEITEEMNHKKDLEQFMNDWGVMPDKVGYASSGSMFSVGQQVYKKSPEGVYIKVSAQCEMADEPVKLTPSTSGVKRKDKSKKVRSKSEDEPKMYSCPNSDDEKTEIPPRVDYSSLPFTPCMESHQGDVINRIAHIFYTMYGKKKLPTVTIREDRQCYSFLDTEAESYQLVIARCENSVCLFNKLNTDIFHAFWTWFEASPDNAAKCVTDDKEAFPQYMTDYVSGNTEPSPSAKQPRFLQFKGYQEELSKYFHFSLTSGFREIYNVICKQWKWIIAAIASICALYFGYNFVYSDVEEPMLESPQAGNKRDHNAPRTLTMKKQGYRAHPRLETNYLNDAVPPQVEAIMSLVAKQKIALGAGDKMGYGIVIANGYALVPRHTVHTLYQCQCSGLPITITLTSGEFFNIEGSFGLHIFRDYPERELSIICHKRLIGKDIRRHILAPVTEDVTYAPFAYVHDMERGADVPVKITGCFNLPPEDVVPIPLKTTIKGADFEYSAKIQDFLLAVGVQGYGKCGSVLFDPQGKIIGMHVAGIKKSHPSLGIGYYPVIYKELFDDLPTQNVSIPKQEQDLPVLQMRATLPNLNYVRSLSKAPYHSQESKIVPSAIAPNAWKSITQPCIQSHLDTRYTHGSTPLLDGASTIGAPTIEPDVVILQSAVEALVHELIPNMSPPSMKVPTSVREAVTAENHRNVEPMKLGTSAGLPLIVDFPGRNLKSDFISHEVTNTKHHVAFKNGFGDHFWKKHNQRKLGIPPREPFWAHLKDERRKVPKLLSLGGTRVFSVAPLELVLTSRMLLLPFMDAFHADPVRLHHGIGLAPDSPMWTEFVEYHRSKGDCLIQLDFSKFSDSMPWLFVDGAFAVIKSYYLKHNILNADVENMLDTIRYEITRSHVCVAAQIFELKNGTLQGHPITSLINSLVNMLEQLYVWCVVTKYPASKFFEECSLTVMGDDVVIAVPPTLIPKYNGQLIAKAFGEMKIQVTDENKDPNKVKKFQPFNEFCFMGRSFQLHPYRNLYLAPADLESIFDTPLWIQKKDDAHFSATQENVGQSLSLMYGHGPIIYEMYRGILQFLCGNAVLRSWYELDYLFMNSAGLNYARSSTFRGPDCQYYSGLLLKNTQLLIPDVPHYMCDCRFSCEEELMKRMKECTKQDLRKILPFTTQLEGCIKMGRRLVIKNPTGATSDTSSLVIDMVAPDIRKACMDHDPPGALYSPDGEGHPALIMDTDSD